ncbi:MAG: class I SAM-dependent methyltransferase, partial [Deltaproteobacteria bacterium]|nr:class I SAM-dependent methyltransferase [Deltaproteobacteria bacterium]
MADRFDEGYYAKFYKSSGKVHDEAEIGVLCQAVVCHIAWLGRQVRSVLDVGAGPGFWRAWFRKYRPDVAYRSIDVSAYACETYGHEQKDISVWSSRERFDLVVCQGVLQYLTDEGAEGAIQNLGAMCGGFMYLEAITKHDLDEVVDRERTDTAIHARTGAWY